MSVLATISPLTLKGGLMGAACTSTLTSAILGGGASGILLVVLLVFLRAKALDRSERDGEE